MEPVQPEDLDNYLQKNYNISLENVRDNDLLFESFSESVAKKNKNFEEKILKEFRETEASKIENSQFSKEIFDRVTTEQTTNYIGIANKNKWIEYNAQMIKERI